jgi:hypothetical protein
MNVFCTIVGASLFGCLLPEFVFMLSPHADGFKRVSLGVNIVSTVGAALLAYGLRA